MRNYSLPQTKEAEPCKSKLLETLTAVLPILTATLQLPQKTNLCPCLVLLLWWTLFVFIFIFCFFNGGGGNPPSFHF